MGSLRGLDGGLAPAVFDFYQTADDRWVIPIACYRRPSDELLSLLGAAHTQEHIRSAIASWISWDLEEAAAERGIPLAVVRSREEFLAHPQSKAIQTEPLVTAPVLSVSPWVTRSVKAQPPSGFWGRASRARVCAPTLPSHTSRRLAFSRWVRKRRSCGAGSWPRLRAARIFMAQPVSSPQVVWPR
ncbi:hypothetical protein [Streptomyces olivaceoviridis]